MDQWGLKTGWEWRAWTEQSEAVSGQLKENLEIIPQTHTYTTWTHAYEGRFKRGQVTFSALGTVKNICKQKFFWIFLCFFVHYSLKHLKAELIFINTVTKEQSTGTEALIQTESISNFSLKWHQVASATFTSLSDFALPVVLLKAPLNWTGA